MARPNLFEFATSELSQDAVLCWLAAWAKPEAAEEDQQLHGLGIRFVAMMLDAHGRPAPEISSLEIKRQHKGIDVLLVVNARLALCIEDKVGSTEHSDQLSRYVEGLTSDGFAADDIIPVYVQTFEQGSYALVRGAGYAPVSRRKLMSLLESSANSAQPNAIVRDFYERLAKVDRDVESFRDQPLDRWSWLAWQGFYSELQARLLYGEWGYVANPAGGFQAYWWRVNKMPGCEQYLQLEERNLCFKISVEQPGDRASLRDLWHTRLLEAGRTLGLDVRRPRRLGLGQTMTVAVLGADYRVTGDREALDLEATVEVLRRAEAVLAAAIRSAP